MFSYLFPLLLMLSRNVIEAQQCLSHGTDPERLAYYSPVVVLATVDSPATIAESPAGDEGSDGQTAHQLTVTPVKWYKPLPSLSRRVSSSKSLSVWEPEPGTCLVSVSAGTRYHFFLGNSSDHDPSRYQVYGFPLSDTKAVRQKLRKVICRRWPNCVSKPVAMISDSNTTGSFGQAVTLRCRYLGTPRPKIIWMRYDGGGEGDGGRTKLLPSVRVHIKTRRKYSALTIRRLERSDAGRYACVAESFIGKEEATGYVTVTDKAVPMPKRKGGGNNIGLYKPCHHSDYCLHGGTCFYLEPLQTYFCRCRRLWSGERCQFRDPELIQSETKRATDRIITIVIIVSIMVALLLILIISWYRSKDAKEKFELKRKLRHLRCGGSGAPVARNKPSGIVIRENGDINQYKLIGNTLPSTGKLVPHQTDTTTTHTDDVPQSDDKQIRDRKSRVSNNSNDEEDVNKQSSSESEDYTNHHAQIHVRPTVGEGNTYHQQQQTSQQTDNRSNKNDAARTEHHQNNRRPHPHQCQDPQSPLKQQCSIDEQKLVNESARSAKVKVTENSISLDNLHLHQRPPSNQCQHNHRPLSDFPEYTQSTRELPRREDVDPGVSESSSSSSLTPSSSSFEEDDAVNIDKTDVTHQEDNNDDDDEDDGDCDDDDEVVSKDEHGLLLGNEQSPLGPTQYSQLGVTELYGDDVSMNSNTNLLFESRVGSNSYIPLHNHQSQQPLASSISSTTSSSSPQQKQQQGNHHHVAALQSDAV